MQYDVFISHASEDKESFVRELANRLKQNRVEVWYDEFSLRAGSSLRRSIDHGLSKSRFGIVVLSPSFFKKQWTNWELDGLVARQNAFENDLIIPVWLDVGKNDILEYSPPLADKVAINATIGMNEVVGKIIQVINPDGSTLIVARDYLIQKGFNPPVVTDDWWLDIVEYSGKEWGYMDYLSFPIPWKGDEPKARGEYIAKHALQKMWQEEADELWLSQLTNPSRVIEFMEAEPGLKEACLNNPKDVALYFPQLTIRGLGGFMEEEFEEMLKKGSRSSNFTCEEYIALRHPTFGNYEPAGIADHYFAGAGGGIGPSTRRYDMINCIVWLLSSKSKWLPEKFNDVLLRGMKEWNVWGWSLTSGISEFEKNQYTGKFEHEIIKHSGDKPIKFTKKAKKDIETRFTHSVSILNLEEPVDELIEKFFLFGFVEEMISSYKRRNEP